MFIQLVKRKTIRLTLLENLFLFLRKMDSPPFDSRSDARSGMRRRKIRSAPPIWLYDFLKNTMSKTYTTVNLTFYTSRLHSGCYVYLYWNNNCTNVNIFDFFSHTWSEMTISISDHIKIGVLCKVSKAICFVLSIF